MAEGTDTFNLVVVGSSAGGIEAVSTLLAGIKPGFPAPIVIAQHLDPSRQSHLAEILARRSVLPVRTIEDREQLIPGTVYVVPSNHLVEISDGHIELKLDGSARMKPSVDLLLTSAAEAFGDRLIAVILSGTGSDGAAGARAVKKAGGTVIIQDPDTAAYPGMPLSLAPTTVDIVATLDKMGAILTDLLAGVSVPTQPDQKQQLQSFLEEICDRFGLDFNSYKTPAILRRLRRRIVATDSDDLTGYMEYLRSHPDEYRQLVNTFFIKVTEFFRDPDLFTYLRETVVPELVLQSRKRGNELRIWSAGCATGEEPYSLAIVVSEALGAALEHFNVRIFATDADGEAIAFARRGVYPAQALSRLPEDLIMRYFTREDSNYHVKKRLRALTVFGQHDLGGRAPFPHIDMILCRNVLIYFTPELQQRTLRLFAYSLRDGGYLVLGKAETPSQLAEFFAPLHKQHKVFRRHGDRILIPPARTAGSLPEPPQRLGLARRPSSGMGMGLNMAAGAHDVQRVRSAAEGLLLRLPIGIVVVDRRYDIQVINSAARRFLSIHGPAIGEDLIHEARGFPQTQLREAIDQALRSGESVTLDEVAVEGLTDGQPRYVQMSCHSQRIEGENGPAETVTVLVQDVTAQVRARQAADDELRTTSQALTQVREDVERRAADRDALVQRLVETNRQLIEANQELTSTNEELRTTNEEFLLSAEEAQAAIEEVETLNEELQATNEELETLNEELQATIEELNTTNDDLNARTVELQELAQTSEQERARLAAILLSIGEAVLVVDGAGNTALTNRAFDSLFGGLGARLVAEDEHGQPLPPERTPQGRAARGESFSMEFSVTGPHGALWRYEAKGEPIAGGDIPRGGVVVIRDITDRAERTSGERTG
jgi:two-component system, chemotaxis family, CheB/CheR fusion protein